MSSIQLEQQSRCTAVSAEPSRAGELVGPGVAVGVGVRYGQEGVVGFGVADADPGAVASERADGDALVEAGRGRGRSRVCTPRSGPGRSGCPLEMDQPSAISASRTRVRSLTVSSTRSNSSSSTAGQDHAAARDAVHGERQASRRPGRSRDGLVRDHEPGPQPGQAVCLEKVRRTATFGRSR